MPPGNPKRGFDHLTERFPFQEDGGLAAHSEASETERLPRWVALKSRDRERFMLRRMQAVSLMLGLAAAIFSSCGGGKSTPAPTPVGKAALYTFIGDAPACDVLSLRITITGMKMKPQGGTSDVAVFPTSAATANLIKVNFASLRDFATVLNLARLPEGTYDQATFTFSVPQMLVYDPTQSPPTRKVQVELSSSGPTVSITPPLTIVKNKVAALRVDLDLLRSLELDAQGQVTGKVNPVLKASPALATEGQGFGELDDLVGFVRSVSPFPVGQNFIGAFSFQLLSGTGPDLSVSLTPKTELFGVSALNQLETGRVAEVSARVDENGNLVANTVEVEDRTFVPQLGESEADTKVGFLGYVTSVTKDSSGNVTQFQFYVREEEPDITVSVPLDSVVVVNVSSTTRFQFSSRPTNFANLPFDATAVAPGQELIVYGKFTKPQDQPIAVTADSIYLKLQTVQGALSLLVQVGSDGKSGALWLAPCSALYQGAPILVFTNNQTAFINVSGLGEITPQAVLLVRGLAFYQAPAGTINGVAVPAGTLVVTARQIHELQ